MIIQQIWDKINESAILVAEVTDQNPNVMYEIGLAHAIGKPVVQIVKKGAESKIPFDFKHLRHIVYDTDISKWKDRLATQIEEFLRNALTDQQDLLPIEPITLGSSEAKIAPEAESRAKFQKQINEIYKRGPQGTARQGGHWEVIMRPSDFKRERIESPKKCKELLMNTNQYLGGLEFPGLDPSRMLTGDDWIEPRIDEDTPKRYWRFFQSGLFMYFRVFHEDTYRENLSKKLGMSVASGLHEGLQSPKFLGFKNVIALITATYE